MKKGNADIVMNSIHYLTICMRGFEERNRLRHRVSLRSGFPLGHENEVALILDDQHERQYRDLIPLVRVFPPY